MKSSNLRSSSILPCLAAILASCTALSAHAAPPALPDPCKLVTLEELAKITGPVNGPTPDEHTDGGIYTCEYTVVSTGKWITIRLHDGARGPVTAPSGGQPSVPLPEFGKNAFLIPNFHDSVDLYADKRGINLSVSMPTSATSVEMVKAIARKALARLGA